MRIARSSSRVLSSLVFVIACGGRAAAQCGTTIEPGLVVNQTWTKAGSPYCVVGDIQVSLLTIEPGVRVWIDGPHAIEVLSTISAVGEADDPIVFEPKDAATRWMGMRFLDTPEGSIFRNCEFRGAADSALRLTNTDALVIADCSFEDNASAGHGGAIDVTRLSQGFTIERCTFRANTSAWSGGAARVHADADVTLAFDACLFEDNTANPGLAAGSFGGGAMFVEGSAVDVRHSTFERNLVRSACSGGFGCDVYALGGALSLGPNARVDASNSLFRGNRAEAHNFGTCFFGGNTFSLGGAVHVNIGAHLIADNCIFACNENFATECRAQRHGGGIHLDVNASADLAHCTIVRNADAAGVSGSDAVTIVNSIIYHNNGGGAQIGNAPAITYTDVQNGYDGEGNIASNPVLGAGCSLCDLAIVLGSPCIDRGDPASPEDCGGAPPIGGPRADMGAHGGALGCDWILSDCPSPANFNHDCVLNLFDFLAFQTAFGNADPAADVNGDGRLNLFDFLAFQTAFGLGC